MSLKSTTELIRTTAINTSLSVVLVLIIGIIIVRLGRFG